MTDDPFFLVRHSELHTLAKECSISGAYIAMNPGVNNLAKEHKPREAMVACKSRPVPDWAVYFSGKTYFAADDEGRRILHSNVWEEIPK